jgi:hypothetical protein
MKHHNNQHHLINDNLTSFILVYVMASRLASQVIATQIAGTSHEKSKQFYKDRRSRDFNIQKSEVYQMQDATVA